MANSNTKGFGFRAAMTAGNTPATSGQSEYTIIASQSGNIFTGAPVKEKVSTTVGGTIESANGTSETHIIGVFNGAFWTDSVTEKPTWKNYYPSATAPANSENVKCFVLDNPFQEFTAVVAAALYASGDTAAVKLSAFGLGYPSDGTAGSTTTGRSGAMLSKTNRATSGKQWRVIRMAEDPENNDALSAYSTVICKPDAAVHQYIAGVAAV